jgi:hypothetical protein
VEVIDYTTYILLCSFGTHNDECATVQESVKVFEGLHRLLSFASEVPTQPFPDKMSSMPSPKRAPV